MQRTPHDQRSTMGRFRVYNKERMIDEGARQIHEGGPWFVEPADWNEIRPYAPGYATADQARTQGEIWEEGTLLR
jgi:hypothetical protein